MDPDVLPSKTETDARERLPQSARRRQLEEAIERQGFVSVKAMAAAFGVSEMTVRRDLDALNRSGSVMRTHGGAVGHDRRLPELYFSTEPALEERRLRQAVEKRQIARRAAGLIGASETIALDVGTTVLALAGEIAARDDLRVFTNSLPAAIMLVAGGKRVYVVGGQVRGPELAVVGGTIRTQLEEFYFDRCFIGVSGLTADGFHDYAPEDAEVKRVLIERSASVVVLCDASKFKRRSFARVAPLESCTTLVTDMEPEEELGQALRNAGVTVIVAPGEAGGAG